MVNRTKFHNVNYGVGYVSYLEDDERQINFKLLIIMSASTFPVVNESQIIDTKLVTEGFIRKWDGMLRFTKDVELEYNCDALLVAETCGVLKELMLELEELCEYV